MFKHGIYTIGLNDKLCVFINANSYCVNPEKDDADWPMFLMEIILYFNMSKNYCLSQLLK